MGKTVNIDIDLDGDEDEAAGAATADAPDIVDEDAPLATGRTADAEVVNEDIDPNDRLPDRAITNVDGSVTLPLLYPQELLSRKDGRVRTRHFTELTFHRLTGADQRAIAATSEEKMTVVAFARSTRLPQVLVDKLFDKLDLADIAAGGQVLNAFLSSGRRTGR